MPGKIDWNATFAPVDAEPVAEIYDGGGKVVQSKYVHCKPPVNCPFSMEDVDFGTYKAALAVGGNRYYYVAGQSVITIPNDVGHASTIDVNANGPTPFIEINVNAS